MNLTPQQKQELADLAPSIQFTLGWMVPDYLKKNEVMTPEMQIAVELNELLKEVLA